VRPRVAGQSKHVHGPRPRDSFEWQFGGPDQQGAALESCSVPLMSRHFVGRIRV
jgi:hypothetical protein